MYWIAGMVWGVFLVLLWITRKEEAPKGISACLKPFYKIALYMYKKLSVRAPGLLKAGAVEQDLARLHPGESLALIKTDYYVKKASMGLAVIVVGTLLGVAAKVSAGNSVLLGADGIIERGDYREGIREIGVTASFGQEKLDFWLQIQPRKLSEEETEVLFEQLMEKLPEYILGENGSLEQVTEDLALEENYEGFPFELKWDSSRPDIVSRAGRVQQVETETSVILTATAVYGEYCVEGEIPVIAVPPILTESQQLYRDMEEMLLQSQTENQEGGTWQLPTSWRGKTIDWEQVVEDNSLIVWAMALVTAAVVFVCADKDLHRQVELRQQSLRRDYPEIVHKLVLFVGAGMTIRGAFCKVAGDYEKSKKSTKTLPAYEEMLYTCRELRAGVSEGAAYEHFGKRTGLTEYIRLSALLTQNLKRGNRTLLERLREEADRASEERLQQSKKLGEEAGTKLLVPMVLLLAVVMVIIMIPAFSAM